MEAVLHRRCCSSGQRRGSVCWRAPCCAAGHSHPVCRMVQEHLPRVEAVREAKRQVEFDFGQTQALEHHNADFNELLEKLPGNQLLLAQPTHIDHYLSSLSEALPAELAAEYDTPRKTVEDEHATRRSEQDTPPCWSAGCSSSSREDGGSCWQEAGTAAALDRLRRKEDVGQGQEGHRRFCRDG